MIFIMLVQLYTSRVVFNILGIQDYGIYNIVASIIVSLSFITTPMSSATQRFISFELGKKNISKISKIFSSSILIYLAFSFIIILIAETIGIWFLNNKINIPHERMHAANVIYHFTIITFVLNVINIPFNSVIIAYERMSFYSIISIFEVITKLIMAMLLIKIQYDKLIIYGILLTAITLSINSFYILYCKKYIKDIKYIKVKDTKLLKDIMSFSGWSMFGSLSNVSTEQGIGFLLNVFFGVTVNAAIGISSQVSMAINQFVGNFQTAFRSQLVQRYATGNNIKGLHNLIFSCSKYSFFLLFVIVCPISINLHYLLTLWLGNIPDHTINFCYLMIICCLLEAISAPLWITIQATGKIRIYQICISLLMISNLFFSYIFLKHNFYPEIVFLIKIFLTTIYLVYRIYYTKKLVNFAITDYLKSVILPITIILFITVISYFMVYNFITKNAYITTVISLIIYSAVVWIIGLKTEEKTKIKSIIKRIIHEH